MTDGRTDGGVNNIPIVFFFFFFFFFFYSVGITIDVTYLV